MRHDARNVLRQHVDMDDPTRKYEALIQRIRDYPMSDAARTQILAEIEVIYGRERFGGTRDETEDDTDVK